MRNPTFCIYETKVQISMAVNAKLISDFVLATRIVHFTSSHLPCLHSSVYVGPVRKPHSWLFRVCSITAVTILAREKRAASTMNRATTWVSKSCC